MAHHAVAATAQPELEVTSSRLLPLLKNVRDLVSLSLDYQRLWRLISTVPRITFDLKITHLSYTKCRDTLAPVTAIRRE